LEVQITPAMPSRPSNRAITPMKVWKPPSHFEIFSRLFSTAGMAGSIPAASTSPAITFVASTR